MKKVLLSTAILLLVFVGFAGTAKADQIFVCQSCTAPPGGDPNVITGTGSFNIGVAGNHTEQNPLLVIVAVYDGNGTPTISFAGATASVVGTYGLTANTGTLTSGTAFAALGLNAGGSESFVNFSGADVAHGFAAPTSFTLYAFSLPTTLKGGSPISLGESGAAAGSFILAYDCANGHSTTTACTGGSIGQTVFTNTGLVGGSTTPTPEPASMLLLGLGLAGVPFLRRKK